MNRHLKLLVCLCGAAAFAADGENAAPADELAARRLEAAIPLGSLRARLNELDRAKTYVTCCAVGLRGYLAERILKQNGFRVYNLSGGWATWRLFHPEREEVKRSGEGA